MPARESSIAVTDAYRAAQLRLRDGVTRTVADQWQRLVDIEDLDGSGRRWLGVATGTIAGGQIVAAQQSDRYLASFLTSELDEPINPIGIDWSEHAGLTVDGRQVRAVLAVSIIAVKQQLARHRPHADAMRSGMARALRVARTEPMDAGRLALDQRMETDRHVAGWRRVTSSRPCGACIGAATGAIQHTAETMPVHAACRCTKEPVVVGVDETVQRPTGEDLWESLGAREQDALFAGTGGRAKADLIRSRRASLEDLVTHVHHHEWHDTITERPLQELLGRR